MATAKDVIGFEPRHRVINSATPEAFVVVDLFKTDIGEKVKAVLLKTQRKKILRSSANYSAVDTKVLLSTPRMPYAIAFYVEVAPLPSGIHDECIKQGQATSHPQTHLRG